MKLPNPRRMYEKARWLRSDGKPSFRTSIRGREPELRSLLVPSLPAVSPQTPLLRCVESMLEAKFRAAVVVKAGGVSGVLAFHDIADYLGGGERHRIVVERYGGNVYKALSIPVQELASRNVVYAEITDPLERVLELMVVSGFGVIPVLGPEGQLVGAVTEGSVVRFYSGRVGRRPVREFMTRNVITADEGSSLRDVLRLMVSAGVRRIPLVAGDGGLRGVVTWRGVLGFVGSHEIFKVSGSGDVNDFLSIEALRLADGDVIVVDPSTPLESLLSEMLERDLDYALVAEGGVLQGILTERDLMFAVVSS